MKFQSGNKLMVTVTRINKKGEKIITRKLEVDPATTRHYIERLVPAARQAMDLAVGTPEEFYQAIEQAKRDEKMDPELTVKESERTLHGRCK